MVSQEVLLWFVAAVQRAVARNQYQISAPASITEAPCGCKRLPNDSVFWFKRTQEWWLHHTCGSCLKLAGELTHRIEVMRPECPGPWYKGEIRA